MGQFEQIGSAVMVVIIMLGMGATLTPRDFFAAFKKPGGLAIGLFGQFGIMPLIGFFLIAFLTLPDAVAVGVLIMACMPGGTTSNMFTYFSKGNLALSVLMTVNSTVFGVLLIPIVISIYASALDLSIPRENIILTLIVILVPVVLGMLIRRFSLRAAGVVEKIGSWLGVAFIILLVTSWVLRNQDVLQNTTGATYFAAIALGSVGIVIGYGLARAFKMPLPDARTVGLETGLQNSPLAISIIAFTFTGDDQGSYMAVPALYSVFIVIIASAVSMMFRRQNHISIA